MEKYFANGKIWIFTGGDKIYELNNFDIHRTLLKQEIKVLKQTFERVVDRKNNVIKSLSTDADEADEQYNVSLRSHLHNVDDLIGETLFELWLRVGYVVDLLSLIDIFFM